MAGCRMLAIVWGLWTVVTNGYIWPVVGLGWVGGNPFEVLRLARFQEAKLNVVLPMLQLHTKNSVTLL